MDHLTYILILYNMDHYLLPCTRGGTSKISDCL